MDAKLLPSSSLFLPKSSSYPTRRSPSPSLSISLVRHRRQPLQASNNGGAAAGDDGNGNSKSNNDNGEDATVSTAAPRSAPPPTKLKIKYKARSRNQARQQQQQQASAGPPPPAPPKKWEDMTLGEKAVELYVGEKGLLFWLNKFAYASIFIVIGGWILFRFVGPSVGLYQLDTPPLSPTSVFKGS